MPVRDSNMTVLTKEAMRKQFHSCTKTKQPIVYYLEHLWPVTPTKKMKDQKSISPKNSLEHTTVTQPKTHQHKGRTWTRFVKQNVYWGVEMKDYSLPYPQFTPADWDLVIQRHRLGEWLEVPIMESDGRRSKVWSSHSLVK